MFDSVSISSITHSKVSKWTEEQQWFIERIVATLKVCLSFSDGYRKDNYEDTYVMCTTLNLLA